MKENINEEINKDFSSNIKNESILDNINLFEKNDILIITKSFEEKIPEIISFLISCENLVVHKIKIVKFLQNIFIRNEMNSEIFARNCLLHNNKLSIYEIFIHEYIFYKNNSNQLDDEISYRRELLVLLDILITQITFDRESYHYILSVLINYLNEKNGNMESNQEFILNSEILNRILILLQKYYQPFDTSKFYGNFLFFSGESESSIKIENKINIKDNKKILNFDDKVIIILFIKVFPPEYFKSLDIKEKFNLLKIKINEKNKESEISLSSDINNNLYINETNTPIGGLSEKDTNCILLKLKKKKIKIKLNGEKIFKDGNIEKEKPEIKEIILFENFIGICYSFMILKNNCPNFIKNELHFVTKNNSGEKNKNNTKSIYSNGFNDEELIIPFLKLELKEDTEQNNLKNNFKKERSLSFNNNEYKEFMEKLISVYIPSRVTIPKEYEKNNLMNTPQLIIEDSINELNAQFNTKSPTLNGVHKYKKIKNDFSQIGGLNNLLPIMELMVNNNELLTKENIEKYFEILISIFSKFYKNAINNEAHNNFFLYLSYFMEKIPKSFYDSSITNTFKKISSFFAENICEENYYLNQQYQNHILMNEQILFKFHHKEQNEIIESMSHFIQNIKSERKKSLSLDIFKIMKILLHLDNKKYKLFCCKKHAEYFIKNNEILEPELYIRLNPLKELLKHLFKEYKNYCIGNNTAAEEAGKSLFKIVTMLASDISPCLQKMIIVLFTECLEKNFDLYIDNFDQQNEILNICLFVFKNSIFDVKEDVLNLIFLILKSEKYNSSSSIKQIFQFITSNVLPYFLLQDEEIIQASISNKNEEKSEKEKDNENMKQEDNNQENINTLKEDDFEILRIGDENQVKKDNNENGETPLLDEIYGEEEDNDSNSKIKRIKINGIINDIKYSLPTFDENLKIIYSSYNKKKLKFLIYNLYTIVYKNFCEGTLIRLCINLLIKLVSKGDLIMISSFLTALNSQSFKNTNEKECIQILEEELKNNQNLIQWLIETCFHAKLIKENDFDLDKFVPGFDINVKIENGKEIQMSDTEKMEKIDLIINISQKLLVKILEENIYNLDYIFTWGKYYYELRNETNNFIKVRDLILQFMTDIAAKYIISVTKLEKSNLSLRRMALYFFDLLFEFVTFYKLKQEDLEIYKDESSLYQGISNNLKYILVSKMEDVRGTLRPIVIQKNIESKFTEFPIFKVVYANWTPLWNDENKINRKENDIYNQCIKGKKNIYIKELECMFYNFAEENINENQNTNIYVNKGIPLIIILYHFFTLIFAIGGTEEELNSLFIDFRLFIILLIISSSTLISQGTGKKKKWPSEEEFKEVQKIIESIFFNFIYFFINRIKKAIEKIKEYKEIQFEKNSDEEQYLVYIMKINKVIIKNLGYFFKILNDIYTEKKKEDENTKGFNLFIKGIMKTMFLETEEIKRSAGFKFMEKIYNECPNLCNNSDSLNVFDKISNLKIYEIFKTKTTQEQKDDDDKLYVELEEYIIKLLDDTELIEFFEKHEEENKKILFPFVSYISARKEAIKNIIPIYDIRPNISPYPKDYYFVPDYIPENELDSELSASIKSVNTTLTKNINLDLKTCQLDQQYKSHNYKKEKERLFSFRGIWSTNEFFYNKDKFKLKYRLLNHLSEDYTRVLLTPIVDVNYYLPQFSKFDDKELFRNVSSYKQINKVADLSFDIEKKKPEIISNKKQNRKLSEQKTEKVNNNSEQENNIQEKSNEELTPKPEEEKNVLYYIGEEIFNSMKEEEKKDIHNYLYTEYIHKKHTIADSDCIQTNACFVKIGFHINGFIFSNSKGIGFYSFESIHSDKEKNEDYDSDRKVCFGSVFGSQMHKYNNFYLWIPYNKIQMFFRRRYFFKKQAIEIFTEDRKSYFFKVKDTSIDYFIDNIKYYMKQDIEDICILYNKFGEKIGFMNKNNILLNFNMNFIYYEKKILNLKNLYEKWYKWEISTLKLLMILNIYANRSYNDINQYPVFPWIITDFESDTLPNFDQPNFIRQMGKPMGMMDYTNESKERKENYELHWKENENDTVKDENYDRYGSHYSTSLYLTYYLVRVFPFSYIRIELQGKKFDDPNRLFNSVANSYENALTQKSDLRELIPEFFCFPEMFLNVNGLNLGEIENSKGIKNLVQGVEMPLWSKNNSYKFIEKHRELLESGEINEKINEWFNIIFGSKQKGKEAKKIGNLFLKQTYEDYEEIYNKNDDSSKIYNCRMVEFGVTPHQIFKNDTYKRQNLSDNNKTKRSFLFNIFQKLKKNQKLTGKELEFEEYKINTKEEIKKFFVFIVISKDTKKERLFLLSKNKIDIITKKKSPIFYSAQKEKVNNVKTNKEKEKEKEDNQDDLNIGDILEEAQEKSDEIENEFITLNYPDANDKEIDLQILHKNSSKELSKTLRYKQEKKFKIPKYRMNFSDDSTILYFEGRIIVLGGFWNGDIILEPLDDGHKLKSKKMNIIKTDELYPITKIIIDKTETFAICTNSEGTIFIYIIDSKEKMIWKLHKKINEGQGEISEIQINENLGIFISCHKNGYCMIYTLPNCKLTNSFRIEEKDLNNKNENNNDTKEEIYKNNNSSNNIYIPNIVFISNSPLPCFTFYIKERRSICIYSINCHFLNEYKLDYDVVKNGIIKYTDYSYRDFLLIYNPINYTIDIHKLTDLNLIVSSPIIDYQFIDFHLSMDCDSVYILTNDKSNGNKILILKPSKLINQ